MLLPLPSVEEDVAGGDVGAALPVAEIIGEELPPGVLPWWRWCLWAVMVVLLLLRRRHKGTEERTVEDFFGVRVTYLMKGGNYSSSVNSEVHSHTRCRNTAVVLYKKTCLVGWHTCFGC